MPVSRMDKLIVLDSYNGMIAKRINEHVQQNDFYVQNVVFKQPAA